MKKLMKLAIFCSIGTLLVGCGEQKNTTAETSQEIVSKEVVKEKTSTKKKQLKTKKNEQTTDVAQKVVDINYDEAYKEIIDKYSELNRLKKAKNSDDYMAELNRIFPQSNDGNSENFVMMHFYDSAVDSELAYDFLDINHDGVKELIIGRVSGMNQAIYYLKDGRPQFAVAGGVVAPYGGTRSSLNIYEDGTIVTNDWLSSRSERLVSMYKIENDKLITLKYQFEYTIDKPGDNKEKEALDIEANLLDEKVFNWHTFNTKLSTESQEAETELTEQKQAVTTSDIDVNALFAGDYSSIIGTWRDGMGREVTFDSNGVVSDVIKMNIQSGKSLNGGLQTAMQPIKSPVGGALVIFLPAGISLNSFENNQHNFEDPSDVTQNRIWMGQGIPSNNSEFYYRVK